MNDLDNIAEELKEVASAIELLCKDVSNLILEVRTTTRYLLIAVCAIAVGRELVQTFVSLLSSVT